MKARTITYERLKSLPGYNHEKIGITVELDDGDRAEDAVKFARNFVHLKLGITQSMIADCEAEIPF